jgi:histidine ammonia-lyase
VRGLIGEQESDLHKGKRSSEDIHSLLDFPEALAGIKKTLGFCWKVIEEEMNSATDNPLVYFKEDGFEEDTLVSAGNFHGEYVAKAADFLGVALFELGKFSESRIQRYINGKISRLPPFLIKNGGLNSGFMIAQCNSPSTQIPLPPCSPKARCWSSPPPLTRS